MGDGLAWCDHHSFLFDSTGTWPPVVSIGFQGDSTRIDLSTVASPNPSTVLPSLTVSPDPTADSTRILFHLVHPGPCLVQVFDVVGRLVRTLSDDRVTPLERTIVWDGRDSRGQLRHSGVYYVRARGENFLLTRPVVRL